MARSMFPNPLRSGLISDSFIVHVNLPGQGDSGPCGNQRSPVRSGSYVHLVLNEL